MGSVALRAEAHLVLDGPAVLGVADHRQLQFRHLLHLPVHVDLLQQAAHLAPQQAHRVLLALPLGQQRGAGRVDGRHPVLQVGLVAGLRCGGGDGAENEMTSLRGRPGRDVTAHKSAGGTLSG